MKEIAKDLIKLAAVALTAYVGVKCGIGWGIATGLMSIGFLG